MSEIQPHGQLMVSVDGQGVGSYPSSREEIQVIDVSREENEEELHDVVSHNIDFLAIEDQIAKENAGYSKIKETTGEETVYQVLQ
ncbi:hypothetical protein K7X08_011878 [Anisodus acutangulus]|uniref:Uncharacterized protein n=1 Tax=Anisodus acutangulus TaxID=402998 RepID=A0A9Q1LD17_9SOLA|nr:hypothetical protein K7X08_011878 [Anisodus acutangulus]